MDDAPSLPIPRGPTGARETIRGTLPDLEQAFDAVGEAEGETVGAAAREA